MPILGAKKLEKLELPSTTAAPELPEAQRWYVVINSAVTIGLMIEAGKIEGSEIEQAAYVLSKVIEDWTIPIDEVGNKAPITIENIRELPPEDFTFLSEWLTKKIESLADSVTKEKKTT